MVKHASRTQGNCRETEHLKHHLARDLIGSPGKHLGVEAIQLVEIPAAERQQFETWRRLQEGSRIRSS